MRASKKSLRNLLAYDIYHHHGLSQSPHHASIVASRAAVEEAKSVVFLHGILGSKRNWRTPANVFRKLHPEFQCITVDFRGHGDSHVTIESEWDENTVDNSALDLYQLTHSSPLGLMNAPTILCAHSFGGKVALRYLEKIHSLGQKLPEHTWILDSIPGPYRRSDIDSCPNSELQSVFNVLEVLKFMPKEFESREWVVNELCNKGIEKSVAMWICTSVKPKEGGVGKGKYEWGFNLTMIEQLFNDFCNTDMWNFLENYNGNGKIHFIRAGKNPSWTENVLHRFKGVEGNKNILLHEMPDVGHWIHAEDLNGMFKIISRESGLH